MTAPLFWILAIVFLVLFYGPWQTFLVDRARQNIFEVRDEIFDLAAAGRLEFDSKEYGQIRHIFQVFLRFAHQMTWLRLVIYAVALRGHSGSNPDLKVTVERIQDIEVRRAVETQISKLALTLVGLILCRSLGGMILLVIPAFILWATAIGSAWIASVGAWVLQRTQIEAEIAVGDWHGSGAARA